MSKSDGNSVPYWEYLSDYEQHREEILKLLDTVISSGRLILGTQVATFENRFAAYTGARFGIGVNSGTDALFLSLKALRIGEGDEVITVSNTAVPTVAAIRAAGATPVFVDVEPDTFLMDATLVEKLITPRTKCILPVHLCGLAADMDPLLATAAAHGLSIVEDCAQAAGAGYRGKRAGSFGRISAFSYYPTKVLGGYGDGGMAVTSDEELYHRLRRLRFYGMESSYYAEEEGYNSRLDEIQAAMLNFRLDRLDAEVEQRNRIAATYSRELSGIGDLALPVVPEGRRHQFYLYTVRTSQRDRLQSYLEEAGIETRINYPTPIHLMRGYRFLGYHSGDLPVTERLAGEILSLPIFPNLADDRLLRVIEAVRGFYRKQQR